MFFAEEPTTAASMPAVIMPKALPAVTKASCGSRSSNARTMRTPRRSANRRRNAAHIASIGVNEPDGFEHRKCLWVLRIVLQQFRDRGIRYALPAAREPHADAVVNRDVVVGEHRERGRRKFVECEAGLLPEVVADDAVGAPQLSRHSLERPRTSHEPHAGKSPDRPLVPCGCRASCRGRSARRAVRVAPRSGAARSIGHSRDGRSGSGRRPARPQRARPA